jgi:hypothetical protein
VRIGLALERRPDHADENLLTVGTGPAPIAATDLARDDRGPDRVFGAQFVASIVGSNRNDQMAVNSRSRCLAKRSTSGTRLDRRHQRDHVGTELGRSGANGIRRLQRMTPLHTPLASRAPADVQINLPDHDTHRRQFFLVLRGDGRFDDRTGAGWTLQRHGDVVSLVDLRRNPTTAFRAVRASRLPAWTLRMRVQRLGKRGRLPEPGSPRFCHLSCQMIDLVAKPFLLALQPVPLPSQRLALAFRVFGTLAPVDDLGRSVIRIAWLQRLRHAAVMPEFGDRYKTR